MNEQRDGLRRRDGVPVGRRASVLVGVLLMACSASSNVMHAFAGDAPAVVAVLPPSGGNLTPEQRARVRNDLANALEWRGFTVFHPLWVDERLALAGLRPWETNWIGSYEPLAQRARELGADGLFVLEDLRDDSLQTVAWSERRLSGRARMLRAGDGTELWRAELGSGRSGGLLTESGQVFEWMSDLIAERKGEFAVLSGQLALEVAGLMPMNHSPAPVRARPEVETAHVTIEPDTSARSAIVTFSARGSPACRATACLSPLIEAFPLAEIEPGTYRGAFRLEQIDSIDDLRGLVTLRDQVGASSHPLPAMREAPR